MKNFYDYYDFRKLLKALYQDRKKRNPNFSYRYIAGKAGFKSAGFLTQLFSGKANVTMALAFKIAEVFGLKKHELEYFEALILLDGAKTQADKTRYFERILKLRRTKHKTIGKEQYELFEKWYYIAVREVLAFMLFRDDYKALAKTVIPNISENQARGAIKVLENLGLIKKSPMGYYERVDATLSTGDFWQSVAITNFQIQCLELARKSYDNFPGEVRDHSTLSLSISRKDFTKIKKKLDETRKEILEIALNSDKPDSVYQMTFNLFPLSKPEP